MSFTTLTFNARQLEHLQKSLRRLCMIDEVKIMTEPHFVECAACRKAYEEKASETLELYRKAVSE